MDIDGGSSSRDGGDGDSIPNGVEVRGCNDGLRRSYSKSKLLKFVLSYFRSLENGKIQCLFCEKSWKTSNKIIRLRDHFLHANMRGKAGARSWRGDSGKKVASANIAGCEKCPDGVYKNILMMTRAKEDRSKNMKACDGLASQILAGMRPVNVLDQHDWRRENDDGSNHVDDLVMEHEVTIHPVRASQPSVGRPLHQDRATENAIASQESMVRKASHRQASIPKLKIWQMKQVANQKWTLAQEMTGMSFRAFVHLAIKETYQYSSSIKGYKFPSEKRLRTMLLDTNYAMVKEATEHRMWDNTVGRRSIVSCDGWTNVRGRALLNILIVSRQGEMLLKHVDGSNTHKDSQWVADNIINEVLQCREFITFIKGHQRSHSMFLDYFSNGAELLKPGATRFATNIIMLDRAYGLSDPLRAMVVSSHWREWLGQNSSQLNIDAARHKRSILDDVFWDNVHDLLHMIEPIYVLLRQADAHKDFNGRICFESMKAQETLLSRHRSPGLKSHLITPYRCDQVTLLFTRRWDNWSNILHSTAMLLNPLYLFSDNREKLLRLRNVRADFDEYIELYVPHVLGYVGEKKERWMEDVETETAGILTIKPKKNACERSWSSYGQIHNPTHNRLTRDRQEKLVYIYHNARINDVETLKRRTATSLLSKFYTSRVQQQMLKKRHGEEYGASGDVNEAWVPTERLNVPQQYTKHGKAIPPPFDWEEQLEEDEVKENMKTTMRTSNIPNQLT
ncbi:hypothetical protein R1sor_024624 [Riccia sorocarpa]|uniref:DUF659 domain-containing protein n=1 Tax=Riccia sorocarpa TaxID=122646 RepID=A0ABD3GRS9_9MARC